VTSDVNARNRATRERLAGVIARLGERDAKIDDEWTAAALLAHLAFWDRLSATRIEKYLRDGEAPAPAAAAILDYTNGGGMRQWKDTPLRVAALQAKDAAAAFDKLVETLPSDKFAYLKGLGRPFLIDRSEHRKEHLDQIERALA
jgi:hypothetical protein